MAFHRFDPPAVYEAYRQGNPSSGIYVRLGSFSGSTVSWSGPTFVSGGLRPSISAFPNIGDALVAWDDAGNVFGASTTNTGNNWTVPSTVSSATGSQNNARTAVGSSYVVFASNQDVAADQETFFSREIPGVTGDRVADLRAERRGAGKVVVSWILAIPNGVARMQVVRDGDPALVADALLPSVLSDEYSVTDEEPGSGTPYLLEVELDDGAVERYGPVLAGPTAARDGAGGCAAGGTPGGVVGGVATLLVLVAAVALAERLLRVA